MAENYCWDNRIRFLVRYMYDLDGNGHLNKNDFDCLAVKFTVMEGRGEWSDKRLPQFYARELPQKNLVFQFFNFKYIPKYFNALGRPFSSKDFAWRVWKKKAKLVSHGSDNSENMINDTKVPKIDPKVIQFILKNDTSKIIPGWPQDDPYWPNDPRMTLNDTRMTTERPKDGM